MDFTIVYDPAVAIIGQPVISGTERVGETLTATAAPSRGGTGTSWRWINSVSGDISGAVNSTYVLQASDEGDTITVRQTDSNASASDSEISAATGVIAPSFAVSNQSFTFGDHTRSGAGAETFEADGGSSAIASIGSLSGTNAADWSASFSSGVVTITPNGDAPANGPYSLSLTCYDGAGQTGNSDAVTISITTTANGWSVADSTELDTAMSSATLANGDTVYLRDGDYNAAGAAVTVSRAAALTADVTVRGHGSAAVIHHLRLGTNADHFNFHSSLNFRTQQAGSQTTCMQFTTGVSDITFDGCAIGYGSTITGSEGDLVDFLNAGSQLTNGLTVQNCNGDGMFRFLTGISGSGVLVTGNTIQRCSSDPLSLGDLSNALTDSEISYNVFKDQVDATTETTIVDIRSDGGTGMIIETQDAVPTSIENIVIEGASIDSSVLRRQYNYLSDFTRGNNNSNLTTGSGSVLVTTEDYSALSPGYTSGGTLVYKDEHADWVQHVGALTNVDIVGNTFLVGDGSRGFNTVQGGIFLNNTANKTNVVVAGNVVEITGGNGIRIENGTNTNLQIWSNVVVRRRNYPQISLISAASIILAGTGSLYDNVANGYTLGSFTGEQANNTTIAEGTGYATEFADAPVPSGDGIDFATAYNRADYGAGSSPANANAGIPLYATTSYTGSRNDPVLITSSPLSPADGATDVAIDTNLVANFNLPIAEGTGNILVREGGATTQTIAVGDAAVTISGSQLTVNPSDLTNSAAASVQIAATCIDAAALGNGEITAGSYAGITNDTTWDFGVVAASGPTFESRGTANTHSGTSNYSATNFPAGVASGDLLVAYVVSDGSVTWDAPSGWTLLTDNAQFGTMRLVTYYRTATETDPLAFNNFSAFAFLGCVIERFSGVTGISGTGQDTASFDPPSHTPASNGQIWRAVVGNDAANGVTTAPTNYSGLFGFEAPTSRAALNIAEREADLASDDPNAFTSSNSEQNATATIAIW